MSSRTSPFAALTGAEKQIRWLEYQSIPLPYVEGSVEPVPIDDTPARPRSQAQIASEAPAPVPPLKARDEEKPPAAAPRPSDFQKTRHSQYDAVIARMKQAEKGIRFYQALS